MKCFKCENEGILCYTYEKDGSVMNCRCGKPMENHICKECILKSKGLYVPVDVPTLLTRCLDKGIVFLSYE